MLKPTIVALLALAVTAATPQVAQAGDWEVRVGYGHGGGRGGVHVEVARRHHDHAPAPVRHVRRHAPVRHVVRRVPVRHVHRHGDHCRWVAGHHDFRMRSVFEPGYYKTVVKPAVYETRFVPRTGRYEEVLVRPEVRKRVWVEGRHVDRRVRVWIRGHWKCVHYR